MRADRTAGYRVYVAGVEDAHGNPVDSWATAVDVDVYGWGPRASTEPGGTQVIVGLEVYAPASLAVGALDRMVVDGLEYVVDGDPGDYSRGPLGRSVGQKVINLKRVEGGR